MGSTTSGFGSAKWIGLICLLGLSALSGAPEPSPRALALADEPGDARFENGGADPAYELRAVEFERLGDDTLRITFRTAAAHSAQADNFGWYACYFDLDGDPQTGTEVLQIGYEVALGVELARTGGQWLPVVHVPDGAGKNFQFTAAEPKAEGADLRVDITSAAFVKYPLPRVIAVSNRGGDFIDYVPSEGSATMDVFPVGRDADPAAVANAASEKFLLSAEGGHYDVHRARIPSSATGVRVRQIYLEEYADPKWLSATGFGLGVVNPERPGERKHFFRVSHDSDTGSTALRSLGTLGNGEKIPFTAALQPGAELTWEASWAGGDLRVRLNGEEILSGKVDFVPAVLHLSVCGAKTGIEEITFQ